MSAAEPEVTHVECCRQFGKNDDDHIEHPCQLNDRTILGWLTCIEVHDLLKRVGVEEPERTSSCARAGIMRGYIRIPDDATNTDFVVFPGVKSPLCGHICDIKLEELLKEFDEDCPSIHCKEAFKVKDEYNEPCDIGCYITRLCSGGAFLEETPKFIEHCTLCPGFGSCVNQCRISRNGSHKLHGFSGESSSDEESENDSSDY